MHAQEGERKAEKKRETDREIDSERGGREKDSRKMRIEVIRLFVLDVFFTSHG